MKLTIEEIRQVIKEKITKDLIVPEHTEDAHYYRHTGVDERYASVTTKSGILEAPHLKKWAATQATKYIDKHWQYLVTSYKTKTSMEFEEIKEDVFKAAVFSHKDQFEEAGDIGTQGHDIVDLYLKHWMETGKKPEDITKFITGEDHRLWAISRSAEMFCNDFDVVPIASEMYVASIKHKFAGTLDSIMLVARPVRKGDINCDHDWHFSGSDRMSYLCLECGRKMRYELTLVDWKTSNSVDKAEYAMQTSAYWYAFYEMTGIRLKNIIIVRLDKKTAKYEVVKVAHRPTAFRAFLNASKVYDWLTSEDKKIAPLVAKERISLDELN